VIEPDVYDTCVVIADSLLQGNISTEEAWDYNRLMDVSFTDTSEVLSTIDNMEIDRKTIRRLGTDLVLDIKELYLNDLVSGE
jgi:hypothetical protein